MAKENIKVTRVKKERTKTQKMVLVSSIAMLVVITVPTLYNLIYAIMNYING